MTRPANPSVGHHQIGTAAQHEQRQPAARPEVDRLEQRFLPGHLRKKPGRPAQLQRRERGQRNVLCHLKGHTPV